MTVRQQIIDDVPAIFLNEDEFAEEVPYTPVGGSVRNIVVIVLPLPSEIVTEGEHRMERRAISVVAENHATRGIDDPNEGDKLTYGGLTYSYAGVIHQDEGAFTVKFISPQIKARVSRNGFGF